MPRPERVSLAALGGLLVVVGLELARSRGAEAEAAARMEQLDARILRLEHADGPVVTDAGGLLYTELPEPRVLQCVVAGIDGLRAAEDSHDAAFDRYEADLSKLGWALDTRGSCDRHVALRARVLGPDYEVDAVVIRGEGRGRRFVGTRSGERRELARLDDASLAALLGEDGWTGDGGR